MFYNIRSLAGGKKIQMVNKNILKKKYSNHISGRSQPTEFCSSLVGKQIRKSSTFELLSVHISLNQPLFAMCIFHAPLDDEHFKESCNHGLLVKNSLTAASLSP